MTWRKDCFPGSYSKSETNKSQVINIYSYSAVILENQITRCYKLRKFFPLKMVAISWILFQADKYIKILILSAKNVKLLIEA